MPSVFQTMGQRLTNGPREKQALAFLRIATGVFFLYEGHQKLIDPGFTNSMATLIHGWTTHHPLPFYKAFLEAIVLPNIHAFAQCVTYSEIAVGVSFVLGFLVPWFAPCALFMNLNYLLASQHTHPAVLGINVAFMIISCTLFWSNAGRYYGLDEFMQPKSAAKGKASPKKHLKKLAATQEFLHKGSRPKSKGKSKSNPF